jgi:hypothetical protein
MFAINPNIIKSAVKCHRGLNCLTLNGIPDCNIHNKIAYEVGPKKEFNTECKYIIKFHGKYLCTCPVRKDIFNKYDV